MSADDNDNDNEEPSMDPLEGMGERAKEASEEFKARQKAELEEEKENQG